MDIRPGFSENIGAKFSCRPVCSVNDKGTVKRLAVFQNFFGIAWQAVVKTDKTLCGILFLHGFHELRHSLTAFIQRAEKLLHFMVKTAYFFSGKGCFPVP